MKSFSFSTPTFGALTSLFLAFLNLAILSRYSGSVQAAVLPRDGIIPPSHIPLDLIPKYFELMDKCNAGGPDAYMGVLYEDNIEIVAKSGECVQRTLDGKHKPQLVVICKTAMCNYYSVDDCTGGPLLPVPLPFVPGEPVPNAFDTTQLFVGAAGKCQVV